MRKKTIPVRMNRELYDELKSSFPEINTADLITIMYKTSPIRLENVIRRDIGLSENVKKKPKKK